jgi:hypothetical protein
MDSTSALQRLLHKWPVACWVLVSYKCPCKLMRAKRSPSSWRAVLLLLGIGGAMGWSECLGAPLFQTQALFTPTATNYYHIPGLAVTAKGTVLAYASWRDVVATDWGDIHTVLRRSTDGGKSWGPEHKIAHLGAPVPAIVRSSPPKAKGHEEGVTVDNPIAIADRNGTVHFLYCVEYRRVFYLRNDDDGLSWRQGNATGPGIAGRGGGRAGIHGVMDWSDGVLGAAWAVWGELVCSVLFIFIYRAAG